MNDEREGLVELKAVWSFKTMDEYRALHRRLTDQVAGAGILCDAGAVEIGQSFGSAKKGGPLSGKPS